MIRKGNFKEDFGFDVECYVLNDENRTAVIGQRGMAETIGLKSTSGTALTTFIKSRSISQTSVGEEILKKASNPLIFKDLSVGGKIAQPRPVHGYDVTLLIDICRAVIESAASGTLNESYKNVVVQANIILSASAKSGIQELVYKLSGFDSTKEHFIQAFNRFVSDEAKKYEKEFPIELYAEWARLYSLKIPEGRGWPWEFKHLTVKHIYIPLAKSDGKLLELLRATRDKTGDTKKKLFQFLNEIGARALRMQLGRVLEMAESSKKKTEYENKIAERFGGQVEIDLSDDDNKTNS